MKDLKFGKVNLSRFSSSRIIIDQGQRGIFIPIEENHLTENFKNEIYFDFVSFKTNKLAPFSHNIVQSVPEKFRKDNHLLGGVKLL